ncbi:kinesin-like protein KIN-14L [Aristolochia californica]|uniref:kinesin-like protein KIN-14L n=1 Tax=Aristolochia californica TaxID=171875 RepID=UPI0035E0E7EC
MEDYCRDAFHDSHLVSRKAEEASWRRFQAAKWLDSMAGPLGLSPKPSEREFLVCLRSGLVLCNTINKIQPGSVSKVVENHAPLLLSDTQPLTAYQYFENVRNFLVAVEELKLPAFEASDLERDTFEASSTAKIVDCILALKSYHEWKQGGRSGNGPRKYVSNRIQSHVATTNSLNATRHLDMPVATSEKQLLGETKDQKLNNYNDLVHLLVKVLTDCLLDSKENIDQSILTSIRSGNVSQEAFAKVIQSCLEAGQLNSCPEFKSILEGLVQKKNLYTTSESEPLENSCTVSTNKRCIANSNNHRRRILEEQEKDLMELKALLDKTKEEFQALQCQLQMDLTQLENQVQGLSTAALGYHRVLKENMNLYTALQDLKGNIRVYCRIRPALVSGSESVVDFIGDDGSLIIMDPFKASKDSYKVFQLNRVFGPNSTQEEVFKDTQPLIRSVMDGHNVCIFAYGQTGSGKTHTMSGPSCGSLKDMGINYMALNDLFQLSCDRKHVVKYQIWVQMVEIYNEQVRDLLTKDKSENKLEIWTCMGNDGLNLSGANMHLVCSTMDVLNLIKLGEMNRLDSSTASDDRSSGSHSILTVHVQGKDTSGNILRSCLHLVDLAGSETVDKLEVTGERLKEAQYIDKSLSCLRDVITALTQKNSHIPYRNSKLTQLLQDSLGGHAKTLMFAHVSPEADYYGETISTLKFIQRVSSVELGTARLNKESCDILKLKNQVEKLKKELAKKDAETKAREVRTPLEAMKQKNEFTPPRSRRLSIENQSFGKMQLSIRPTPKSLKSPVSRGRRLSLEGAKNERKGVYILPKDDVTNRVCSPSGGSKMDFVTGPSTEASHQRSPRNPQSRMRISAQLPKSPDPSTFVNKSQMPSCSSTTKKGSHIRKSLQTIGKFINGSDKGNLCELKILPVSVGSNNIEAKSPIKAHAQASRRQSLTGVPTDASRRASLWGKIDSYLDGNRNARTPPPVHYSSSKGKRWL